MASAASSDFDFELNLILENQLATENTEFAEKTGSISVNSVFSVA